MDVQFIQSGNVLIIENAEMKKSSLPWRNSLPLELVAHK